jgi:hypothetical protein
MRVRARHKQDATKEAHMPIQTDYQALSGAAKRMLGTQRSKASIEEMTRALPGVVEHPGRVITSPTLAGVPVNVRVNDPGEDVGAGQDTTQSEPTLAVYPPHVVVAFNDSNPVGSFSGYSTSGDAGISFTDDVAVSGAQNGDPVLAVDRLGTFYYAMLSTDAAGNPSIGVAKSTDFGATFAAPVAASAPIDAAGDFQDKEWLACDTTGGANDRNLYLAWTRFQDNGQATVVFARSTDQNTTWSTPTNLSAAGSVNAPPQGAMPSVAPDGSVYVTWLDRSNGELHIRRSVDGGATFTNPVAGAGALATITQIPGTLNGSIDANSFPSIAVSPAGTLHLVCAQMDGTDTSNVFHSRSTDQGQSWSALHVVNDVTAGDQWMPSVAVASNGVVGVMYYDRRNDPANMNIDVYLSMSTDDGVTFAPAKPVTDASFPPEVNFDPIIRAGYMGDYNQMVAAGTRFYLAWGDNRDTVGTRHDPNVYFAVVGTEDCYVRDNPADDGTVPSTAGQAWQSPDILPQMNPSVFGTPNPVTIQVHNFGPIEASQVTVRLYWADPATYIPRAAWRPDRIQVGTATTNEQIIAAVPAGGMNTAPQPFIWNPPDPLWATQLGHFCLLAEIESVGDPLTYPGAGGWQTIERDNNLAVRNVHVQPVGSHPRSDIHFFIGAELETELVTDLCADTRQVPPGMEMTLRISESIARHAKVEGAEIVHGKDDDDQHMRLQLRTGRVTRITGLRLPPGRKSHAVIHLVTPRANQSQEGVLRLTQQIAGQTVGGLLYLLEKPDAISTQHPDTQTP